MMRKIIIIAAILYMILVLATLFSLYKGRQHAPEQRILNAGVREEIVESKPNAPSTDTTQTAISGSLPVAPLNPGNNMTATLILETASVKGLDFCNSLEEEYLRQGCVEQYLYSKAERDVDPELCKQGASIYFERDCMANAIITAVALRYYDESDSGRINITPSNIQLCDELENEGDKALCHNPAIAIEKNFNQILYKLPQ